MCTCHMHVTQKAILTITYGYQTDQNRIKSIKKAMSKNSSILVHAPDMHVTSNTQESSKYGYQTAPNRLPSMNGRIKMKF